MDGQNPLELHYHDLTEDLDPTTLDWLLHSQNPKAVAWRGFLRQFRAWEADQAMHRQKAIKRELIREEVVNTGSKVRRLAVIDPWIMADMRRRYGMWWNDKSELKDTKKRHPELFAHGQ